MATQADSTRAFRNGFFALGVIGPVFSFSPEEFVVGINHTNEHSLSKLLNLFKSPSSVSKVIDTIGPIPGML